MSLDPESSSLSPQSSALSPSLLMHVGCEFRYETPSPTPSVMLVRPHPEAAHRVLRETWEAEPDLPVHGYRDGFGNRCDRFTLPIGATTLRYDALLEVSAEPDPVAPETPQLPVEELPDEVLLYTLASRYCEVEALSNTAWHLFGATPPGWGRVQAVCDWLHTNIRYGALRSTPLTSAVDVYVAGGAMCRDFAHLAVTFCRALNIPARYVFGYISDIDIPPPHPPMDFHAWFEVYLGDRWWPFDARFNRPLRTRAPIGRGRDAVDVAMMTTYGPATFHRMTVWTDVVENEAEAAASAKDLAAAHTANESVTDPADAGNQALLLSHGNG